jgi:hypothetical protein
MSKKYVKSGVVAHAGGGQANATQILEGQDYTEVATVATAGDSLVLPAVAPCGSVFTVRNSSIRTCDIFPPADGNIDDLGVDEAFPLPSGCEVTFTVIPNHNLGALGLQFTSNEVANVRNVRVYDGVNDVDLLASESGSVVAIPNVAGNTRINLPAPTAGANFTMVCSGAVSNANHVIIEATGAIIRGHIVDGGGLLTAGGSTTIRLGNATGAMAIGDKFELVSDGTSWFLTAVVANRTHLTLA